MKLTKWATFFEQQNFPFGGVFGFVCHKGLLHSISQTFLCVQLARNKRSKIFDQNNTANKTSRPRFDQDRKPPVCRFIFYGKHVRWKGSGILSKQRNRKQYLVVISLSNAI